MFDRPIKLAIEGGLDLNFPRMIPVRQKLPRQRLDNLEDVIRARLPEAVNRDLKGLKIAIGVGSRGIARQVDILREVIVFFKNRGAHPFIVPAMGSHGGATAEGQTALLSDYGISEQSLKVPVRSTMEAVQVATLDDGTPLYCDRLASMADAIVLVNKIKPHADFKGVYESGLVKMLAIGLSKHKGATALHYHGFETFHRILPVAATKLLEKLPILLGVAILENAYDELMDVVFIPGNAILENERQLLETAKANIPRILIPKIDVLIIDEIGKNISGEGMDPNVTGRPGSHLPGFDAPEIQKVVVLGLTGPSHGNGVGIGMADVTTARLVKKLDLGAMYTNAITAGILDPAKVPLTMPDDREAIAVAVRTCPGTDMARARIVRIKNTLELERIEISEALYDEVLNMSEVETLGPPAPMLFDARGQLQGQPGE